MFSSILILCIATAFGGAETHTLQLYQKLLQKKIPAKIFVTKNSPLESKIISLGLPYYSAPLKNNFLGNPTVPDIEKITKICKKENIKIISCNEEKEAYVAKKIKRNHPIKIVFTRHVLNSLKKTTLQNTDTVVAVSTPIKKYLQKKISLNNIDTKIELIPPLYYPKKFEDFNKQKNKPSSAKTFFEKNFNITLGNKKETSILLTVANLYPTKNHALLQKAVAKIIHEKNKPVELILAGEGPLKNKLLKLAKKLKISEHVHFLGFTNKIPEILYYSDIHILPSKKEGLGIALLEASVMQKPSIASTGTGMSDIIKNNITGLLFKNNDLTELVQKIDLLISNKNLGKKLGKAAHRFVKNNFSIEKNFEKYVKIYKRLSRVDEKSQTSFTTSL